MLQMFLFGSLALEQFVDRLIEWPQYCNHILQISHLRSTHSEIVSFIEQALARISSGHLDVDGASHASVISNHHSAQATIGHVEVKVNSFFPLYLTCMLFSNLRLKFKILILILCLNLLCAVMLNEFCHPPSVYIFL